MTSITKLRTGLPSAVLFLTLGIAGAAAADTAVPFKGSVQGHEIDQPQGGNPPQQLLVNGRLTGVATQLGQFTMTYRVTVNLDPQAGAPGSATGTGELTAANGDTLLTSIVGQGVPVEGEPTLNKIVEIHTITGGTGRFANATGSFILERIVDLGAQPAATAGSFQGTIARPGGAH